MTESADYILAKIIELNKDIDKMELFQSLGEYALIIGVCLVVISIAVMAISKADSDIGDIIVLMFFGGSIIAIAGGIDFAGTWFELQFMYDQMDGLVIAYESVYGLLPEGIL